MPVKDGGPAFPLVSEKAENHPKFYSSAGMSLRDYFAAHAPISFEVAAKVYGSTEPPIGNDSDRSIFMAVWTYLRYEYADAMIAEREK